MYSRAEVAEIKEHRVIILLFNMFHEYATLQFALYFKLMHAVVFFFAMILFNQMLQVSCRAYIFSET